MTDYSYLRNIKNSFVHDFHGDDPDQTLCTQVYITKLTDATDNSIVSNF